MCTEKSAEFYNLQFKKSVENTDESYRMKRTKSCQRVEYRVSVNCVFDETF